MSKSKKADVPAIYPLKGEHKKPEHVKPQVVEEKTLEKHIELEPRDNIEPADIPDVVDLPKPNKVPIHTTPQKVYELANHERCTIPFQQRPDIYDEKTKSFVGT